MAALDELTQPHNNVTLVVAPPLKSTAPQTFQSPALNDIEVISCAEPDDTELGPTELFIYSPTLPAAALSFVVVPMMPEVVVNATLDVVIAGQAVAPSVSNGIL